MVIKAQPIQTLEISICYWVFSCTQSAAIVFKTNMYLWQYIFQTNIVEWKFLCTPSLDCFIT